jgi:hypothetical protein
MNEVNRKRFSSRLLGLGSIIRLLGFIYRFTEERDYFLNDVSVLILKFVGMAICARFENLEYAYYNVDAV